MDKNKSNREVITGKKRRIIHSLTSEEKSALEKAHESIETLIDEQKMRDL